MNTEHTNQSTAPEPFGYFKTEPFGWTDCEKGDEGAVPLYEHATVQGLQSQLEAERGSLFAESQRKQQLQGQVDALMEAMAKISRMTMSMYTSAGEAMRDAKRIAHEAIAAAEQTTLCASCARADVSCPIYPQQTDSCVEHRPAAQQQAEPVNQQMLDALSEATRLIAELSIVAANIEVTEEKIDKVIRIAREGSAVQRFRDMIAAAEQAQRVDHIVEATEMAQQAEPVAAQCRFEGEEWKYCTIAHHLLVQAHPKEWPHYETRALYAQPPAVAWAVPGAKRKIGTLPVKDRYFLCHCEKCGWIGSSEECRESINHMYGDGDYYCPSCGANGPDEMASAEATFNAMLAAAPQAAAEGCGACGDGCPGQGCRLGLESPPTCQKCNGAGVIRGLLSNGGGSYAEPCPDCTAPKPTAEDSSAVPGNAAQDAARYRLLRLGRCWSVIDGLGAGLQGEELDAAVDVALGSAAQKGGAA